MDKTEPLGEKTLVGFNYNRQQYWCSQEQV